MSVPVLTAVTGARWESDLVAALDRSSYGVTVVRRCVDLADLLAAAASGTARAVLVSADLRRLDRDALSRLQANGVVVVGLVTPGDDEGEQRLHRLGVADVLPADAGAERISSAVVTAIAATAESPLPARARDYAEPVASYPDAGPPVTTGLAEPPVEPGTGRLVAVWGPTGAPGRTTVAVNLAAEVAALGAPALLADADVYGGVVAQVLGLLDEAPGLASAARAANAGTLDVAGLARLGRQVDGTPLRVLSGIARADRWPELRPAALDEVWRLARSLAAVTVVDCGFSLEQDEEIAFDTAAPRRNGATLATLEAADVVVVVGGADPVGVQRLVRGLGELRETVPSVAPRIVLNRVRAGAAGANPERQLAAALDRFAGVDRLAFIPDDQEACDRALSLGRTLAEAAPDSPARQAIATLAAELAGRPAPAVREGRRLPWRR